MSRQKQIEEMAKVIGDADQRCYEIDDCNDCPFCDIELGLCKERFVADALYTAGYRKSEGEWVVISKRGLNSERNRRINYETYTCAVCGRSNGKHKANFCPNCGARMMKGDDGK